MQLGGIMFDRKAVLCRHVIIIISLLIWINIVTPVNALFAHQSSYSYEINIEQEDEASILSAYLSSSSLALTFIPSFLLYILINAHLYRLARSPP